MTLGEKSEGRSTATSVSHCGSHMTGVRKLTGRSEKVHNHQCLVGRADPIPRASL